jgi:hypothetical protein
MAEMHEEFAAPFYEYEWGNFGEGMTYIWYTLLVSIKDLNSSFIKSNRYVKYVNFTAVTMKNAVFWDVTPCDSCKNQRFRGT